MTAPRVRVVIVNYNGGDLTLAAVRSALASDWPRDHLDVVVVDNASSDGSVDRLRAELPEARVLCSPRNVGFGAGCNLALTDLDDVDYVALVNNDVAVPATWLRPLVETLESDANVGAACPKIVLQDQHRLVTIQAPADPNRLDPRPLGVRLSGVRVKGEDMWRRSRCRDGFWGPEYVDGEPVFQWTGNGAEAHLLVPHLAGSCELLLSANRPITVTLSTDDATTRVTPTPIPSWYPAPDGGAPLDVIHNVGTELGPDGYASDRGYLEVDRGQYDDPTDVFAWCGGAVLLSTRYLGDIGLFDENLFLYYEDVELAWRGRDRGWRTRTVPQSVVRHLHSATASADALRAAELNERNHLLVLARHGSGSDTARALWHYARATASYARRDLAGPVLRREPPRIATVAMRVRALWGFTRRARVFRAENPLAGDRSRTLHEHGEPERASENS